MDAVTHRHLDHVEALEALMVVYSHLKAMVHRTEAPFLMGGDEESCYAFALLMSLIFEPGVLQQRAAGHTRSGFAASTQGQRYGLYALSAARGA